MYYGFTQKIYFMKCFLYSLETLYISNIKFQNLNLVKKKDTTEFLYSYIKYGLPNK